MKGLKGMFCAVFTTASLFGIHREPWILPPYEFEATVEYEYNYTPRVNNAVNPDRYSTYENELFLELSGSLSSRWYLQVDVLFDGSRQESFGFDSVAPCVIYQFLNDLAGDPLAFSGGTYFRYVPRSQLSDITTPYAGEYNFDFMFSVGKEFDRDKEPVGRFWGNFDVGIANQGAPYIIVDIVAEAFIYEKNILKLGTDGYFGFGSENVVNVNNFDGYGKLAHRSMNVKVGYEYDFPVWGSLSIQYSRNVYAVTYLSDTSEVLITYSLNFSF